MRIRHTLRRWLTRLRLELRRDVAARRAFAAFLERLSVNQASAEDWAEHVATHYWDGHLERTRRGVARRLVIAGEDRGTLAARHAAQLRQWARELRDSAV